MMHPTSSTAPVVDRTYLLRIAVWFAIGFGLAEAALVALAAFVLGRFMHVSPQLVWQAPLSFAIVFVCFAGLVMFPWPRLNGRLRLRGLVFACAFVGCVSLLLMISQLSRWAVWLLAAGIGAQLSFAVVRFEPLFRRAMRLTLLPFAALVALLGLGLNAAWWVRELRQPATGQANDGSPNVVLIIWDTVRAASLSLYGYDRPTTPTLERLAATSVVFENAFSTAPWTLPSHASMLTGLGTEEMRADWTRPFDDNVSTLAEVLSGTGYRTGGFVANTYFAGREAGLSEGFAHYEDYPLLTVQQLVRSTTLGRRMIRSDRLVRAFDLDPSMELKRAEHITNDALDWIARDSDRPFFAFLNYLDAHSPYSPPQQYATRFGNLPRHQKLNFGNGRTLTRDELQAEINAYDAAITYLDDELRRFLNALDSLGVLDNTIVVVTSDHGEEFGEHDVYLHGSTLFDRSLHVPLLIRASGSPGGVRRDEWVSLRHLPSTILDLARIEGHPLPGRSLTWAFKPDESPGAAQDAIYAAVSRRPGVLERYPAAKGRIVAVMLDPLKYILNGDGTEQVFDLRTDREEIRNLIDTAPAAMLQTLRSRAAARQTARR